MYTSQIFKHALVYGSATILAKLIGFVMLPFYAHYLHGEGYGIIGMIDTVLSVLTLLIGYGITGSMKRFYFQKKTEHERKVLVSTTIILMFFMVVGISIPALFFCDHIAVLAFGKQGLQAYIFLTILNFISEMTSKNAEAYILIRQKSFFYSVVSICRLVISLALNIYLIAILHLGVLGYLYSSLIVSVLFSIFMHINALKLVGIHFNKTDAAHALQYSLPLLPGYIAGFFRGNADRVILRTFLGLSTVGVFEMIYKFATLIGVLVMEPFMKIWSVKSFEICESQEGKQSIIEGFTIYSAIILFIGLILSVEIPLVLKILTPREFWVSGTLVSLAVFSRMVAATDQFATFGLNYAKKTFFISLIQILVAALSIGLNLLLIKPLGLAGALIASCCVALTQNIIAFWVSHKYFPIAFEWSKITKMVCIALGLFFIIDYVSLSHFGIANEQFVFVADGILNVLSFLHLNAGHFKAPITKLVLATPVLIDGCIKLGLSCLFIGALFVTGVFNKEVFLSKTLQKLSFFKRS